MIANRAIKARAKASPDRIQTDIRNSTVIIDGKVEQNDFVHLAEADELATVISEKGNVSVPLNLWLSHKSEILARMEVIAVQIASDEMVESVSNELSEIDMVVLPIVNFVDGRSYSHAHKLRNHFGFSGEIRVVGDVHYDQLNFLQRCGCNSFELPDGDDLQTALKAFSEFSDAYQPAADTTRLIFSRRRRDH